ncbi:hypothetical protein ES703_123228 [subsurface metagenome]
MTKPSPPDTNVQACRVVDDSWAELGITWNNQPAHGIVEDTKASVHGWMEWTVTPFVIVEWDGNRIVSICLRCVTENFDAEMRQSNYRSTRYNGYDPELYIEYTIPQKTLTITSTVGGTTDPSPDSYDHNKGANVSVLAIPDSRYVFDRWELDGVDAGDDNPIIVPMDEDYTIHAVFVLSEVGTLIVTALADSEEINASFLVNGLGPYDTLPSRSILLDPRTTPYTVSGSYKGQTQTETVTIRAGEVSTVTLHFKTYHKLTIITDPTPIDFTFNTEAVSSPFERDVEKGTYTMVMPGSIMVGVDEYLFTQWENGSVNPKRTVTIGSPQAVNLTATYTLKQIEGTGPLTQRENKDNLRQVLGQEGDIDEDNPLSTRKEAVISSESATARTIRLPLPGGGVEVGIEGGVGYGGNSDVTTKLSTRRSAYWSV